MGFPVMRATRKKAAVGELRMFYGRLPGERKPDVVYAWGDGSSKRDAALLREIIPSDSVLRELCCRGYDLKTLEFRIRKKA